MEMEMEIVSEIGFGQEKKRRNMKSKIMLTGKYLLIGTHINMK
ncbi:unnamed protein product [Paramecium primaurelia]|uniref:Uncharacterized protein n=1 Tax=Paramecium primaurelia TaxID=5886 RepID=A0A8S1L0B2_PARPR|nr:unnamed protein product [Paramecium primaurelia]